MPKPDKSKFAARSAYTEEDRAKALSLATTIGVKEAAKQFGIKASTLYSWWSKNKKDQERTVGWWEGAIDIDKWLDLPDVTPEDAAMLLWRINPKEIETKKIDPFSIFVDEDGASSAKYFDLLIRFKSEARACHKARKLADWLNLADKCGLDYHGWISEYLKAASTLYGDDTSPSLPTISDDSAQKTKHVYRQREQEQNILSILEGLGYNPKSVPKFVSIHQQWPKRQVFDRAGYSKKVFDLAWERLRKCHDIQDASGGGAPPK